MRLIAITGMKREAKLIAGPQVAAICSGGDAGALAIQLERMLRDGAAGVISIGLAAGLQPGRNAGDCIAASEIVAGNERISTDEHWLQRILASFPQARCGAIAGTGKILAGIEAKASLASETNALAADMESHIVARAARAHEIAFAAIRVISDDANRALPPAALNALTPDGGVDIPRVLGSLVRNPLQLFDLLQTAGDAAKAMQTLLRCRDALGPGLGCPYLA